MEEEMQVFTHDDEVREVVRRFEQCRYSLQEFDHGRHLAVGMAYLDDEDFEAAICRMRASLQRFSRHHGKMGYHETMTRFWLLRLQPVRAALAGQPLWQACNAAIKELADKDLVFQYYHRDELMSDAARHQWVKPQKRPDSCPRL